MIHASKRSAVEQVDELFRSIRNPAVRAAPAARIFALMRDRLAEEAVTDPNWRAERRYLGVDHWLLEHGRFFEWRSLPFAFTETSVLECHRNSRELGLRDRGLAYAEGNFCSPVSVAPAHHAWNVDERGEVVDFTLGSFMGPQRTYFGVVLDSEHVLEGGRAVLSEFNGLLLTGDLDGIVRPTTP